jgi:hypothetical protein
MSKSLWTWGGTYFGEREGNSLFSRFGVEAGRFRGDEIYGADGMYLGEIMSGMLITDRSKRSARASTFSPQRRVGNVGYVGNVGTVMYAGFEDFPGPDRFK